MFCPNCGNQYSETYAFCPQCGTPAPRQAAPQAEPQQDTPPQTPFPPPPLQPASQQYIPQSQPSTDSPVEHEPPAASRKKNRKLLIVTSIVTAIALVIGCTLGWYFLWGPGSNMAEEESLKDDTITVYAIATEDHYDEDGVHYSTTNYTYNDRGQLLSEILYLSEEGVTYTTEAYCTATYQYNDQGYLLREKRTIADDSDSLGHVMSKDYLWTFSNGLPTSVYTVDQDGNGTTETFQYQDGFLSTLTKTTNDGEVVTCLFQYQNGRLVASLNPCQDNKSYDMFYEYDASGNLTCITLADENGEEYHHTDYTYAEKDNLTKASYVVDGKQKKRINYTYDESGNLTKMVIKWDYDYKMTLVYQYNGSILQSITVTEEDDEEATRSYECDSNGNIVRYTQDDGSYTCYTYTKLRLSKADYAL